MMVELSNDVGVDLKSGDIKRYSNDVWKLKMVMK